MNTTAAPTSTMLTDEQIIALLTDEGTFPDTAIERELLEEFSGYEGFDFEWQIEQVAEVMRQHYDAEPGGFMLGLECNSEREISAYVVSLTLADFNGYLSSFHDIKHSTDSRAATGLDAAVGIWRSLQADLAVLRDRAARLGVALEQPRTYPFAQPEAPAAGSDETKA